MPMGRALRADSSITAFSALSGPALADRLVPRSASREARLDAMFERLVRAFRGDVLRALETEPEGPARLLRAYLRSVCDHTLRQGRAQSRALQLLMQPQYEDIWRDFVAEACAGDTVDADLSQQCRAAVEALWLRHAADHFAGRAGHGVGGGGPDALANSPVLSVRDYLLSLCDACASAAPSTAEPQQAPTRRSIGAPRTAV